MNHYSSYTVRELRARAHHYNIRAAQQTAAGKQPVWDRNADFLEEVLDELTSRVGLEAVEMFRDKLAHEHAHIVETAQARETELVTQ